jgi:hypothetical protein
MPVATLRLEVAWPDGPKRHGIRNLRRSKATGVLALTALVLLVTAGMFVATVYLSGLLTQRIQHLQRYNEPRVQYSDVWKWQGQR